MTFIYSMQTCQRAPSIPLHSISSSIFQRAASQLLKLAKEKMDQTDYHNQNQQTLTRYYYNYSIDNQLLKKVTRILLSLSVFSFCFPKSSLLSFLHSLNFYFTTFPYQLFTHTIDKNCIFLICNLLLVILAKYSGLIRSSAQSYRISEEATLRNIEGGSEFESPMLETEDAVLQKEEIKVGRLGSVEKVAAEEEKENESLIKQVEKDAEEAVEEYKEQEPESGIIVLEEEEEEENGTVLAEDDEGNGRFNSSTEDLNKKFEDFIRKMKEELRIEAQGQAIMV